MMIQRYKGYLIEGSALIVHPFNPDCYVVGKRFRNLNRRNSVRDLEVWDR
jgi:hypothetical protein